MTRFLLIQLFICIFWMPSFLNAQSPELDSLFTKIRICMSENSSCDELFENYFAEVKSIKSDSAIGKAYSEIAKLYTEKNFNPIKVIEWTDRGIDFIKDKNVPIVYSELLYYNGVSRIFSGREGDVQEILEKCMAEAKKSKDYSTLIKAHNGMATLHQFNGDIDLRIQQLLEQRALAEEAKDSTEIVKTDRGLATAFYDNGDFDEAYNSFQKAASFHLQNNDSLNYYRILSSSSNCLLSLDRPKEAVSPLKECIQYMMANQDRRYLPFPRGQLARAYNMLDNYEESIELSLVNLEECSELNLVKQEAYVCQLLSTSYAGLKKYIDASIYSQRALDYYEDQSVLVESLDAQALHASNLKGLGKYRESLQVYERMMSRKDSLMDERKMKEIAKVQSLLELEKKENMLCVQENEISLLEKEKIVSRNKIFGLVIGLMLLGIIAWLMLKRKTALVKIKEIKNEHLKSSLDHNKRELTSNALHLAQKNEFLLLMKDELEEAKKSEGKVDINELINKLKFDQQLDNNWDQFLTAFKQSSPEMMKRLHEKHPDLSKKDIQLCAFARMGLTIKDIASMLNVTPDAVKKARYRLRKKIGLDSESSLENYLQSLVA